MRIAISGHRDLYGATVDLVNVGLSDALAALDDGRALVGITCLAAGADQMFADAVLHAGGTIEAIVPASATRDDFNAVAVVDYDRLLANASTVTALDYRTSDATAHMAASLVMLEAADHLIAVWDGQAPRGPGGTADVVNAARQRSMNVTIVWPDGAQRGRATPDRPRLLYASNGDADQVEHAAVRTAAARTGALVTFRPAPAERPDVVLELRRYTDPVDDTERWAVITVFGSTTVIDAATEAAARDAYEETGDAIGAALYMGRATLA
ncbi:hypothetical protein LO763_22520 [Glycomyces sp. A-F 0318]|uniref:hypothetical protein n=1 Tax=Glycomyces amatae TaxID=2881355 RepID=UPI001E3E2412|nr:hypothetical protein [Glycomyces amatae]MCD0446394.1 hypothetical protein [Glycomyces amatae]